MGADVDDRVELSLWGKAGRGASEVATAESDWHPLLCHILDVAAVAEEILRHRLSPYTRGHLPADGDLRWLTLVVALHDFGKATPSFQAQVPHLRQALEANGFVFRRIPNAKPHGATGTPLITQALTELGVPEVSARTWARAVAGHHGTFPSDDAVYRASTPRQLGEGQWVEARRALMNHLLATLSREGVAVPQAPLSHSSQVWLAGITCLADWVGSNADVFRYRRLPIEPAVYWNEARELACVALDRAGVKAPHVSKQRTFAQLFAKAPWPLHEVVEEVAGAAPEGPVLLVIESPMGEGKTEAALLAAEIFGARFGTAGLFVGLPTQATANQMLGRVRGFLASTYADASSELHLVHGNAALSDRYQALRLRSISGDGPAPEVVASEWFSKSKRALLAAHAVGTVDQALLGVLHVRHGFVRLFGLSGKTVVLDEVHAYDTYTSDLLDTLVAWLARLGANVVILSATLPRKRRNALVSAFRHAPFDDPTPYPRVTWATPSTVGAQGTSPRRPTQVITVTPFPTDETEVAAALWSRIAAGGTAAWICNTVGRAQRAFRALSASRPEGVDDLDLLHARFVLSERNRREERICRRYGPGHTHRPTRGVVVGTQVLEQSLDLDFDFMVSDIAPVDLVVQRVGRLHRHDRTGGPDNVRRPEHLLAATLGLCQPPRQAARPDFSELAGVYDEEVMLRSWLALDRPSFRIPEDLEGMIEQVYGDATLSVPSHLEARLAAAAREREERAGAELREASLQRLEMPWSPHDIFAISTIEHDDEDPTIHRALRAMTRLGDPSVEVVCLHRRDDGFVCADGSACDLDAVPTRARAAQLLRGSLRISHRGLVPRLVSAGTPASWRRSPFLRHHRLITFEQGVATVGPWRLELEPELGLVIDTHTPTGAS